MKGGADPDADPDLASQQVSQRLTPLWVLAAAVACAIVTGIGIRVGWEAVGLPGGWGLIPGVLLGVLVYGQIAGRGTARFGSHLNAPSDR